MGRPLVNRLSPAGVYGLIHHRTRPSAHAAVKSRQTDAGEAQPLPGESRYPASGSPPPEVAPFRLTLLDYATAATSFLGGTIFSNAAGLR